MINVILTKAKQYHPQLNEPLIKKAYDYADAVHVNQTRKSGQPMIEHAATVAELLTEIHVDSHTLAGGLLHDVIEYSDVEKEDLASEFDESIAELVDGVSKIKEFKTKTGEQHYYKNLQKLFLASSRDIRIILIRLAEKVHNLQTIAPLPHEKQLDIAQKALDIYAPLAEQTGVSKFKRMLDDLAFAIVYPEEHDEIATYYDNHAKEREALVEEISYEIENTLSQKGISTQVYGRAKHLYSSFNKYTAKHKPGESITDYLANLNDKLAFTALVDDVETCYRALSVIHQTWPCDNNEFDDYISNPKPNGYQSIHTAVYYQPHILVEIQIKTHAMHEYNEYGPASHVYYKELGYKKGSNIKAPAERIAWLKNLLEWQDSILSENKEGVKIDLYSDQIFIFTPKGDVIDLPHNATPIDFAYRVHSDVGNHMISAEVNGKRVALDSSLNNGDVCEIVTSKSRKKPSSDWLQIVKTRQARDKIKRALY